MTRRKRRGSLIFPVALIFLGVLFLLTNLGVVDSSIWSQLIRYWPVLLILLGIDALLRHSSVGTAVGGVIGTAVLIAAGIALFHLFAPEAWITQRHAFTQPLGGATSAQLVLSCRDCRIDIGSPPGMADSESLISGSLSLRRDEHLTESVWQDGDESHFRLESDYRLPFLLSAERDAHIWNVAITESVPLGLTIATNGGANLDFIHVLLDTADISTGDGQCTMTLPSTSNPTVYLSGSHVEVSVPRGVGVRVSGSASIELTVPDDYIRTEDGVLSPDYESAAFHSDIVLRPGSERIEIAPESNEDVPTQSI